MPVNVTEQEARDAVEAAREAEWKLPSFGKELFLGNEWHIRNDEELRIVPKDLWEQVRERRTQMHRTWAGGNGKRGFSGEQGSRQADFPTHLLAGSMLSGPAPRRSRR
jgi:hypothetical protein